MKINIYYPVYTKKPSDYQSFRGSYRVVRDSVDRIYYRTTTVFFRGDLNWEQIANFLHRKYANSKKVNIIDYGCSSGEETISLLLCLKKISANLQEYKKFVPIIAKDIDKENITDAKRGFFCVNSVEKANIERYITPADSATFKPLKSKSLQWSKYRDLCKYKVKFNNSLMNDAKFSLGNLINDIQNLPAINSVLFCRNLWAYIPRVDQIILLKQIAEKFKGGNCCIVFGDYDDPYGTNATIAQDSVPRNFDIGTESIIHLGLKEDTFRKTPVKNVFEIV